MKPVHPHTDYIFIVQMLEAVSRAIDDEEPDYENDRENEHH